MNENQQETDGNEARDLRSAVRNNSNNNTRVVGGETSPNGENQQQHQSNPTTPAPYPPEQAITQLLLSLQQQVAELKQASENQSTLSGLVQSLGIVANQAEDKSPGDTPTFNGDPLLLEDFMEDVENQYTNQTKDGNKLMPNFLRGLSKLMLQHGGTKQSYKNFLQSQLSTELTWNEVKKYLRNEFKCAYAKDEQWDKLWKLSMGNSFRGYYQSFMAYKEQLDDELCLTTTRKLFFNNMPEDFMQELLKKGFCSMEVIREAGLSFEQRIMRKRKSSNNPNPNPPKPNRPPPKGSGIKSEKAGNPKGGQVIKFKPLSDSQKEKLRLMMVGRCFGCGNNGHIKTDCKVSEEKQLKWKEDKKKWIKDMIEETA